MTDFARDMFLFSLYARGMNYVDMAYLKKSSIKDGMLTYISHTSDNNPAVTIKWDKAMLQIADLFGTKRPAITKHLSNIYTSGELDKNSTCSILEHMGNDGKQRYATTYYNLDVIISVSYRVNSINATSHG